MKYLSIITVFLISLSACKSDQDKLKDRIAELEQIDTGTSHLPELANAYMEYINTYGGDSALKMRYMQSAAEFNNQFEKFDSVVSCLEQYRAFVGDSFFMHSKYAPMEGYAFSMLNKTSEAVKLYEEIGRYRMLDAATSMELTKLYFQIAKESTDQKTRATAQLKAALLLKQSGDIRLALDELTNYYNTYSSSENAPYAMMESATILEKQFNDLDSARSVLQALIERYPEDQFAKEAKIYLDKDLLGKSDLEQLEIIRKDQGS